MSDVGVAPHGWFEIPGRQTGERHIKERIRGLAALLPAAKGADILDLGCAEGLIGRWVLEAGHGASLRGLDKHGPYIETARQLVGGRSGVRFDVCDFDEFETWREHNELLPRYGIVLALNIVHKLAKPAEFLTAIAGLSGSILALSLPADVIDDPRSGNVKADPQKLLRSQFDLIARHEGARHPRKGHLGIRMIFKHRNREDATRR